MTYDQGGELKFDCPNCGGVKKLYLNRSKGVYYCFRCQSKGRIRKNTRIKAAPQKPLCRPVEFLPSGDPIYASPVALKYLSRRGAQPRTDWLYCAFGKFAHRIIIPVYCENVYRGFQARTIIQDDPRYQTARGMKTDEILYNYDMGGGPLCYLAEGVFGALRLEQLGRPAVASFTKRLTQKQAALIAIKWRSCIVAFDKDATSEARQAGFMLYRLGVTPFILQMRNKGPDDHSVDELRRLSVQPLFDAVAGASQGTIF